MDLSSLNLENLGDIMSSLSEDDVEKLNSLAGELFGNTQKESEPQQKAESSASDFFSGIDPVMMSKVASLMGKLNSAPKDPRCDFIASLKPLLSKDRQQKADEAIKMLQLLSLIPLLGDAFQ